MNRQTARLKRKVAIKKLPFKLGQTWEDLSARQSLRNWSKQPFHFTLLTISAAVKTGTASAPVVKDEAGDGSMS